MKIMRQCEIDYYESNASKRHIILLWKSCVKLTQIIMKVMRQSEKDYLKVMEQGEIVYYVKSSMDYKDTYVKVTQIIKKIMRQCEIDYYRSHASM